MIGQEAGDGCGEIPESGGAEMIWTEKLQNKNFEGGEWYYHKLERESANRLRLKLEEGRAVSSEWK